MFRRPDGVGELHAQIAECATQGRGGSFSRLRGIAEVDLSRTQDIATIRIFNLPSSDDLRGSVRVGVEASDIDSDLIVEGDGAIPRIRRHVRTQ